ncbi:26769_t:CDS:1, partial [Gigaspora margarita]
QTCNSGISGECKCEELKSESKKEKYTSKPEESSSFPVQESKPESYLYQPYQPVNPIPESTEPNLASFANPISMSKPIEPKMPEVW